ncbi:kinase-like protein [Xylona heveae TC161]|uniref:Kinase-like protein n=1 Tax=Xylona heveae (strain CBS 132557 / TC161) TaxID=1328760 RepID=A0A165JSF2_XYLHT|nr:kinase-like protein [Xylona heveae TC161]KZF26569.1 kinase-like protein [Xylona heveae TC161]
MQQDDPSLPDLYATCRGHFIGMGVTALVYPLDEHRVLKYAFTTNENAYTDNQSLKDIQIERIIYQRLGTHPRICKFICAAKRGIVLERLGIQLRRRLYDLHQEQQRPSYEQALKWSCQAAEGMAYIHHKGVIQGDFGGHNMLFDEHEDLKITDFGGSSIDGSRQLVSYETRSQRWNALEETPSIQNELFALGSAIYEIWTTVRPYHDLADAEVETNYKIQCFPKDVADLPVGNIVLRCWLGKYDTADQVLADLKKLPSTEAETAEAAGTAEKAQPSAATFNPSYSSRIIVALATTLMTGFILTRLIRSRST